jgi:tetratricopeptide (TPR) repeat protein
MSRIDQLKQFLQDEPNDEFSRYALALEYMNAGNDTEAMHHFKMLAENHPDYLATYYQMGKVLERQGKNSEAVLIYEKGKDVAIKLGNRHTLNELNSALDSMED